MTAAGTARAIVVMGVSGSGKSTVAVAVARRLNGAYLDADEFHSDASRSKMRSGVPLTDLDRGPWLRTVGAAIDETVVAGVTIVVACSALRREYRDTLRASTACPLAFIHLHGSLALVRERIDRRSGHFMPAALLESQFAALEPLGVDEDGVTIDIGRGPESILVETLRALQY